MSQNNNFRIEKIRTSAAVTTNYVDSTVLSDIQDFNQVDIYCYITKASLTSMEFAVWSSIDNTNWVQETNITVSGAVITMNNGYFTTTEMANLKLSMPMSARFIKVAAKGTGTVTSSALEMWAFVHYV